MPSFIITLYNITIKDSRDRLYRGNHGNAAAATYHRSWLIPAIGRATQSSSTLFHVTHTHTLVRQYSFRFAATGRRRHRSSFSPTAVATLHIILYVQQALNAAAPARGFERVTPSSLWTLRIVHWPRYDYFIKYIYIIHA